jgi:hypothetical protein
MAYEVDQSNKIESGGDTALALSNGMVFSVLIPAREKRHAFKELSIRLERLGRKYIYLRLFSASLYFLLLELPSNELVVIDVEYQGHESHIRTLLLSWLNQSRPDIMDDQITFGLVGKKSRAHKTALAVYQKELRPDRIIKADDLLDVIIGR